MCKRFLGLPLSLTAILFVVAVSVMSVRAEENARFIDYASMEAAATGKLRNYMKAHPGINSDSLRKNVLGSLTDGHVGKASDLLPAKKKKLTPQELYETARKSSLIFGKMEHNDNFQADSAYKTASAVVLTPDGVCATNYHVVADLVLSGALGQTDRNDLINFVMDCDGNVFPLTGVLAVDPINDWAIIKVDPCGQELTPAPVGDDVAPGTPVYCLASPTGNYFHFTDGMVSNRTRTFNKRTGLTKYILDITADYGVGASGGPIFDECGNLVALVSSTLSVYAQPQQYRNFQMAYKQTVPVFLIKECFTD
ncbi:MAG: trypsin-like peptidase domain-containing protein [Bacteroides sp.]|nr:trypsin-like peptidase domain-containing protein [Bacteroides sp.]